MSDAFNDVNDDKAFGGRLGLSVPAAGVIAGVSGLANGAYDRAGQYDLNVLDVDVSWRHGNWDVQFEFARVNQEAPAGPIRRRGCYAQVAYRPYDACHPILQQLEGVAAVRLRPVRRHRPGGGRAGLRRRGSGSPIDRNRYTVGLNYYPYPSLIVKVAYEINDEVAVPRAERQRFHRPGGVGLLTLGEEGRVMNNAPRGPGCAAAPAWRSAAAAGCYSPVRAHGQPQLQPARRPAGGPARRLRRGPGMLWRAAGSTRVLRLLPQRPAAERAAVQQQRGVAGPHARAGVPDRGASTAQIAPLTCAAGTTSGRRRRTFDRRRSSSSSRSRSASCARRGRASRTGVRRAVAARRKRHRPGLDLVGSRPVRWNCRCKRV